MFNSDGDGRAWAGLMMAVSAGALYVSGRGTIGALVGDRLSQPGRRAVAQWIPIAATALAAVLLGQPQIAVTLIFATTVASLSLVLGLIGLLTPTVEVPPLRKIWGFILPLAILCLVIGFGARWNVREILPLLLVGSVIFPIWMDWQARSDGPDLPFAAPIETTAARPGDESRCRSTRWRWTEFGLGLALAVLGGWAAVIATLECSHGPRSLAAGAVTSSVLSPLLILAALGSSSRSIQREGGGSVMTSLVGTAFLNLCVLLPVVTIAWRVVAHFRPQLLADSLIAAGNPSLGAALPYPLVTWQVDTVALIAIGLALLPVALGRWALGRVESGILVLGYAVYLGTMIWRSVPY